jgi:hypothetical protein
VAARENGRGHWKKPQILPRYVLDHLNVRQPEGESTWHYAEPDVAYVELLVERIEARMRVEWEHVSWTEVQGLVHIPPPEDDTG